MLTIMRSVVASAVVVGTELHWMVLAFTTMAVSQLTVIGQVGRRSWLVPNTESTCL
jgi:hypothetical protein